jgi:hypothetical protein
MSFFDFRFSDFHWRGNNERHLVDGICVHRFERRLDAAVVRRLAIVLTLSATVAVVGCGRGSPAGGSTGSSPSRTGAIVINPQFDEASTFAEGLGAVRIGDYKTGKWGYIDKAGHFAVNPRFDWAGHLQRA